MHEILKLLDKIKPEWPLRIGLGIMYLYSGVNLFLHPSAWQWALPYWLKQIIAQFININGYLRFQGVVEIIMALCLLAWFLKPAIVKWVAFVSSLEMTIILVLALFPFNQTNFLITFRDIGLLGAALALLTITTSNNFPKVIG